METVSHNSSLTNYLMSTYNTFRPYMSVIRYKRFNVFIKYEYLMMAM